jgi:hypothetical protein
MPDYLVLEMSPTLFFVSIKTGPPHTSQGLPHEAWGYEVVRVYRESWTVTKFKV